MKLISVLILCVFSLPALAGKGVYQTPEAFIESVFGKTPPKPKALWITKALKPTIESILMHKTRMLRVRYWGEKQRTAWILDEIGKEKPITVGIVINKSKIERIKVLTFRESRGYEIVHPFFTKQFNGITLSKDQHLSQTIDGISGATLSVRAVSKLSRIALLLHEKTPFK